MSSEQENIDFDSGDDLTGSSADYPELFGSNEPEQVSSHAGKEGLTARTRLEALREKRALHKAIFDDLYNDDSFDED